MEIRRRPIPVYREDPVAQPAIFVYNFLVKKNVGAVAVVLTGIFAGPMNYLSFGVGVPIFIYLMLMGVAPHLVSYELQKYYSFLMGAGFIAGPFFTAMDVAFRLAYDQGGSSCMKTTPTCALSSSSLGFWALSGPGCFSEATSMAT